MAYFVKRPNKELGIEPEETLLDRRSAEEFSYAQMETPFPRRNFAVALIVVALVLVLFAGKTAWLSMVQHGEYSALADFNKTRHYPILAMRGIIFDRNMTPLVENIPSFDIVAVPADLPKDKLAREQEAQNLEGMMGAESGSIAQKFSVMSLADINPTTLMENLPRDIAILVETKLTNLPGIEVKKNAVRRYSDKDALADVLGYVGKVTASDIAQDTALSTIDDIGKSGIELSYDSSIRGIDGIVEREVDAAAHVTKESELQQETTGMNVVLTIDEPLQKEISDVLKKTLTQVSSATGAAAVALDPNTGEILALVSVPSYDNNIFSDPLLAGEYAKAVKDPSKPFFNRAVSGVYPPGSSIKPFYALAALKEGVITPTKKILSTGGITVPNPYNPNFPSFFADWKAGGHGWVDLTQAIAESVNTYFYTIGGGYGDVQGLGIDRMMKYLSAFGFGAKASIDIPGENAGTLPSAAWKQETIGERWVLGDTYNASIGQGYLLVTPLQLARGYAMLANGGKLVEPFVVKKVTDQNGKTVVENEPHITDVPAVDAGDMAVVRNALRVTVQSGTATRLSTLPVAVAGKTGTAQVGTNSAQAWFSSFAPYDHPTIAMVILVENGGEGTVAAVPAAKEIYDWYFSNHPQG